MSEYRDAALEAAIEDRTKKQRDVARLYAASFLRLAQFGNDVPSYATINNAIIRRWPSGLERVKKMA
jgi:hypothetical protein